MDGNDGKMLLSEKRGMRGSLVSGPSFAVVVRSSVLRVASSIPALERRPRDDGAQPTPHLAGTPEQVRFLVLVDVPRGKDGSAPSGSAAYRVSMTFPAGVIWLRRPGGDASLPCFRTSRLQFLNSVQQ